MKLIKMLVSTALAVVALAGANTASADSFCTESGHHASKCPAPNVYLGNVLAFTEGTTAVFLNTNHEVLEKCRSEILGLGGTISSAGEHKSLKILFGTGGSSLVECNGICAKKEIEYPFWLLLEALTLDAFISQDGSSGFSFKQEGCPLGLICLYDFSKLPQLLSLSGNTLTATNVPLTRLVGSGLSCPELAYWDVTYSLIEDSEKGAPIYLAALP